MQSIRVTLFSEKLIPHCVINIPILSYENLVQRVEDISRRHSWIPIDMARQSLIECRELFQESSSELFFFPSSGGKCVSLAMMDVGEMFFLRASSSWGFILCFTPNATDGSLGKSTISFSEKQGYPAEVDGAASFFLSHNHISILVSEHGSITINNDGESVLKGIDVVLLQKKKFYGKSIFVQKKNECVSPSRPFSEDVGIVNLFPMNKKYIKIRCVCKTPGFCYLSKFPVLSEKELKQEIKKDQANRIQKYGHRPQLSYFEVLKHFLFQYPSTDMKRMIIFPRRMGIDVPFGTCERGRMFFSYADTTSSECLPGSCKLTFFPSFFDPNKKLTGHVAKSVKKDFKVGQKNAFNVCEAKRVTTFILSGINLVSFSPSEYQLIGANVVMTSTKNYGGWCVYLSRETINLANSPIPGPSGGGSRETQQEGSRSPLPGPSGVGRRKSTTQVTATVSVPSERQGQQTQQRSRSPLPDTSGVSHQLIQSIPLHPPAESTAFVPFEQTQQKRSNPVLGPSGVSFRPYGSHPYGTLPFCEGLYSYRSPITPHHQAAATVSISPGEQGQQTQQEGRSSSLSGPSGIEHRETTASFSQAEATVVVPPEQQRSRSPLRETSGVRHQLIRPIPFRSQPAFTAFMQFEQTQQGRSRPAPVFYGISSHTYFQHEPWPFSGGFYPYGYPYPPCHYPPAREGQWMPVFPPPFSDVRPPVAAFDPLRYEISVQKEDVGHSGREEASVAVPVGSVQQASIWRPYEEEASAEVFSQAQAENSSEETD